MGFRILFTEDSLADLEAILNYFDNSDAAEQFGTALLNHVELLRSFPRMGEPVAKRPGVRKLLHTPIRVYDRLREGQELIEILHFWHAARTPPKI